MDFNVNETRHFLREADFHSLFIEGLGWDRHAHALTVTVDDTDYALAALAEKRGMVVFLCTTTDEKQLPDYATRRAIQRQVAKVVHEHVIIYTDAAKTTQIWQWVKRAPGKPNACREHRYHHEQAGDALLQKLQTLAFSLEEEDGLSLVDVTGRVRAAFDVAPVTKRFYERFKKAHDVFLQFLNGIPDVETQKWFVSVMLTRLMFIYFIQKKGFLNGDTDYLRTNLTRSKAAGTDRFYRAFLCPLFFEGFAKPKADRTEETNRCLGDVPYLNGGIFLLHPIEQQHGDTLQIPDEAFAQLFTFFESYQWHLDERPLRNDNEINPDVLGYIFEKYINQKQMGAYYTQEDITDYISKNTIIPFLFDAARNSCKIAFEGDASVWQLLQTHPARYIYDAVKTGVKHPLPPDIALGIDDVSQRAAWNTLASDAYALPTEIWREVVARRQRYERVRAKLANGEITDINALITENLDIRQFAQDVLEHCEGPELLRAFWNAITQVTILDPTCGSGAFLFAALNILEPLYEACLERMQAFVDEADSVSRPGRRDLPVSPPHARRSQRYSNFRKVLGRIAQHPNRRYFILKSIIINNLYGVDIMDEAVEICKLRLFLKMVAQIDDVNQIEPLPDIDFNVRAGNTLVGYATYDEVEKAVTGKFDFDDTMTRIRERAEDVEALFSLFRQQQTKLGGDVTLANKQALQEKLAELSDELNGYLAGEYGIDTNNAGAYQRWLSSHQPFHWFIAFYGILKEGGFDVVIGNPPYVEYSKVKKNYTIRGYETERCGNLYAFVMERGACLNSGRTGWIVPISWVSTNRMAAARHIIAQSHPALWINNHADRPGSLFVGVHQKLTIALCAKGIPAIHTTGFCRCYSKEGGRNHLFTTLAYSSLDWEGEIIRKFSDEVEAAICRKVVQKSNPITSTFTSSQKAKDADAFHLNQRLMMWVKCFLAPKKSKEFRTFYPIKGFSAKELSAVLNSTLFFWFWETKGDCWHLTKGDLDAFHIDLGQCADANRKSLIRLADTLERHLEENKEYVGTKQTDYEYYHKKSKHIIDEIDRVLAEHYGFTDEEVDFIINYAIKYRMGLGNA